MTITFQKTILLVGIVALGSLAIFIQRSLSQTTPIFWITWSTGSYSAPGYEGKTLPTNGTNVSVAFELIQDGKVIPLGSQEVRWFLDEAPVQDGNGLKQYSFQSNSASGSRLVRIELPDFRDIGSLTKSIQIPAVSPEVVLDAPYVKNSVTSRELVIKALPYYFNVTRAGDLNWNWQVNNETPSGAAQDPSIINILIPPEMPSGSQILTKVSVVNSTRPNESANTLSLFTIQ